MKSLRNNRVFDLCLGTVAATMLALAVAPPAMAVPIVNENKADSGVITIYGDNLDPNRFYVAPNIVLIAREKDVPMFSYYEVRGEVPYLFPWLRPFTRPTGILQMLLVPTYTRDELEVAKAKILQTNPNAQFSGLPFISSELLMSGETALLIQENQCSHGAGLIGQQQSCSMVLTDRGRSIFRRSIDNRMLFTTFQFNYEFLGFARLPDGSFREQTISHSIAVRIDGDQLADHPELISRR